MFRMRAGRLRLGCDLVDRNPWRSQPMWLLSVAQLLTFLAPGGSADPSEAVPPGQPEPIQTRQTYFAIRLKSTRSTIRRSGPWRFNSVSRDRGVTWEHANSVPQQRNTSCFMPQGRRVPSRADATGQAVFAQLRSRPGLRVVVGTRRWGWRSTLAGGGGRDRSQMAIDGANSRPKA